MNREKGTYIYLYRKILKNRTLIKDTTGFAVFVWLLLRADYKTGTVETGRFAMSADLDLKPTTCYSVIRRLKDRNLIVTRSNNHFTTISIVNWHDFQGSNDIGNDIKMTTNQQPNDTIQVSKEVNKYTNNNSEFFEAVSTKDKRYEDIISYLVNEKNIPEQIARLEIGKFYSYWTEPNRSGTKLRWEMEKTFEVQRRLLNWLSRVKIPQQKGGKNYD